MFSQQGLALQKMGNLHDYYDLLITQTNASETPISFEDVRMVWFSRSNRIFKNRWISLSVWYPIRL